jgi:hypothetical protein
MRRDYEIFERLPNGSSLWHGKVRGQFEAKRKLHELAERPPNEILAMDSSTKEILQSSQNTPRNRTHSAGESEKA